MAGFSDPKHSLKSVPLLTNYISVMRIYLCGMLMQKQRYVYPKIKYARPQPPPAIMAMMIAIRSFFIEKGEGVGMRVIISDGC